LCLLLPFLFPLPLFLPFLFYFYRAHRDLLSFPTRRSSDLDAAAPGRRGDRGRRPRLRRSQPGRRVLLHLCRRVPGPEDRAQERRSEEHTSELQSLTNLVCRLLLEKKKNNENVEC